MNLHDIPRPVPEPDFDPRPNPWAPPYDPLQLQNNFAPRRFNYVLPTEPLRVTAFDPAARPDITVRTFETTPGATHAGATEAAHILARFEQEFMFLRRLGIGDRDLRALAFTLLFEEQVILRSSIAPWELHQQGFSPDWRFYRGYRLVLFV